MSKKILLMYLGGETKSEHLLEHWRIMNTSFINKDNYYIVIHPKTLDDYRINDVFLSIFNHSNIFIVNDEHHIKTAWATHSLTEATLLMMQYANIQNNSFFDKYVLLSSSCLPLYNLDEIYNELIKDNKSWLNGTYMGANFIFSQWAILDKQHAKYFFNKDEKRTYNKEPELIECVKRFNKLNVQNISIIKNEHTDEEYYLYFQSWLEKSCYLSDEIFIGTFILKNKLKLHLSSRIFNAILNTHIRCIDKNILKNNLKNIPLTIKSQLLEITNELKQDISYLLPVPLGTFNNDIYKSESTLYDNVNLFSFSINISNSTLITILPTYLDLYTFGIAPDNVLRDFSLFDLDINEFINKNQKPSEILSYINSQTSRSNRPISTICAEIKPSTKGFNGLVNPINNHPVEYSYWTLRNMLNTLIFLIKFFCFNINYEIKDFNEHRNDMVMDRCFKLYQKIIFREFSINDKYKYDIIYDKETYDLIIIDLDTNLPNVVLDKKFGTFLTNSTILAGYSNGSLFIRKCFNTSCIEKYSHILKNCKYSYTSDESTDTMPIVKPDIAIGLDIRYYKKYLKYKNKYIKLKNKLI